MLRAEFLWLLVVFAVAVLVGVSGCDDESTDPDGDADADVDGDTDADADVDGDADGDGDADADADGDAAPTLVTLANETPCSDDGAVKPDPGEEGHLLAVRLTPEATPYEGRRVRYRLQPSSADGCSPGVAHRFEMYVTSELAPDATPTPVLAVDVPAAPDHTTERLLTHELDTFVTVGAGEHLFVAVVMAGEAGGDRVCVAACDSPSAEADRNYWSGAASPPYDWATLASFGMNVNAEVFVQGVVE